MGSGSRGLIGEAMGWVVALALCAIALVNYDLLKDLLLEHAGDVRVTSTAGSPQAGRAMVAEAKPRSGHGVELRISRDGHFHADAEINGRNIGVLIDTGATMVALTYEDAQRAGLSIRDSDFTHRVSTANGTGRIAPVMLDRISIGEITVHNVQAAVTEPGRLNKSLLGMAFLGRLSRTEMRAGVLVLED